MPTSQAARSRAAADQPFAADDPSAIRLLTLPDLGPPFDDDPVAAGAVADIGTAGYGATGSRTRTEAPGQVATTASVHGAGPGEADPAGSVVAAAAAHPGQGPVVPEAGPDGDWARQFARLLTEALSGARPVRQILPWTSQRARTQLRALMPLFADGQRPRLLRVIATRPTRDVIEMTVIAGLGARTRAVAVRLQRADPADRPAWLDPAGPVEQRQISALPTRTARVGTVGAARWLCTDIEAA